MTDKAPPPAPEDRIRRTDSKPTRVAKKAMPKPETRALVTDVALRTVGRVMRQSANRKVVGSLISGQARRAAKRGGLTSSLVGVIAARIATRSVPGALLVGGVLAVKAVRDYKRVQKEQAEDGDLPVLKPAKKAKPKSQ